MKKRAVVFNIISILIFALSGIFILASVLTMLISERHDPDLLIGSSVPMYILFGILPLAVLEISLYRALGYFICKDKADKSTYKSVMFFIMAAVCISIIVVGALAAVSEIYHLQFFPIEWAKERFTYLLYRFLWIPVLLLIVTNLTTV